MVDDEERLSEIEVICSNYAEVSSAMRIMQLQLKELQYVFFGCLWDVQMSGTFVILCVILCERFDYGCSNT